MLLEDVDEYTAGDLVLLADGKHCDDLELSLGRRR